ncbi:hypothetical protein E1269_30445 [Jiangella asiatica]|uniref:Uncharacterized protein n=1 Tax=Jiangella asiatica TaxID=2530372 RepID=A0A4R5CGJ9_9ACTN|nr:hypothetical protein E1269_30445 [Jiangella asiatica]
MAELWWGSLTTSAHGGMVVDTATGDEVLPAAARGKADRVDAAGLLTYADGRFTLTPSDGAAMLELPNGCATPTWSSGRYGSWVGGAEAIVQLCLPDDHALGDPVTVAVLPWDQARPPYELQADLGPPKDDPDYEPPFLIAKLRAAVLAIAEGGTRLTALG